MADDSQISAFYANKKILITGGTGFMGKVLIWKLLYSCPNLDAIFVLIRSKYGKKAASRKDEIFNTPIFTNFKNDNPKILDKVVFISGDVGEEEIGLSEADRNMLIEDVSIVFHSAAILKMDANLRTAVNVNTLGTVRMLHLAMEMKKLEAFVYNSTAFCCCENLTVEEKIYPAKDNPHDIINLIKWMKPELLDKITPQLIHPLPNTYTYSKRLTEAIFQEYVTKVPLIVARPSVVMNGFMEPLPGWNDNLNGPGAFFVVGGKGLLRTTMMNKNGESDFVPVDIATNALIALPWANSKEKLLKEISVYNISRNAHENITWGDALKMAIKGFKKYPFDKMLWYPTDDIFTTSILVYTLKSLFFHYLPAYIIDFIMMLIGEKKFLVRAYDKLRQGERVLRYFTQQQWKFEHDNVMTLEKQMDDTDKKRFLIDMHQIRDIQEYLDNIVYGAKVYIFKQDMTNMSHTRKIANIMYTIDKIAMVFKYYLLWKILTFLYSMVLRIVQLYQT